VRHLRSVAYSVELVLLNKHQIWDGAPKLDYYLNNICHTEHKLALWSTFLADDVWFFAGGEDKMWVSPAKCGWLGWPELS